MLFWDVNNGIARRAWGTNDNAVRALHPRPLLHLAPY
jgi:hypothetical protein